MCSTFCLCQTTKYLLHSVFWFLGISVPEELETEELKLPKVHRPAKSGLALDVQLERS